MTSRNCKEHLQEDDEEHLQEDDKEHLQEGMTRKLFAESSLSVKTLFISRI
jgi:hypothetical protein